MRQYFDGALDHAIIQSVRAIGKHDLALILELPRWCGAAPQLPRTVVMSLREVRDVDDTRSRLQALIGLEIDSIRAPQDGVVALAWQGGGMSTSLRSRAVEIDVGSTS